MSSVLYWNQHPYRMAYLNLSCPTCSKRTFIQDDDERSFCMHCGSLFDRGYIEAQPPLDSEMEGMLRMIETIHAVSDLPDQYGKSWYDGISGITDMLVEGSFEEARDTIAEVIGNCPDDGLEIRTVFSDALGDWIERMISDGSVYQGGLSTVLDGFRNCPDIHGDSMFSAFFNTYGVMVSQYSEGDPNPFLRSLYNMVLEYPAVEADLRLQVDLCTDFMRYSGDCLEAACCNMSNKRAKVFREYAYRLQDLVRMFGDTLCDYLEFNDKIQDDLAAQWSARGIGELGSRIMAIGTKYAAGELSDTAARKAFDEFLEEYKAIQS